MVKVLFCLSYMVDPILPENAPIPEPRPCIECMDGDVEPVPIPPVKIPEIKN